MPTLEPETKPSPAIVSDATPLIFVVEDDDFLRDLLVRKLVQEGFRVTIAEDGNTAMQKLKEEKPYVILLDLILPGMDGFAILKFLRASTELKDVPVLVLSNLGQREDVQRALQLGASDYLVKAHFTPAEILAKLKQLIRDKYVV